MSIVDKRIVIGSVIVVLSLVEILLAGAAWFANRASDRELKSELQRLQDVRQRLESEAESTPVEPAASDVPGWRLLTGPDVVATLQVLQQLGDAAGVTFDSESAGRASDAGKQPFVVEGRGTPHQVCDFVAAIERSERLIVVETGQVLPADATQVAFKFGLATYHTGAAR